MTFDFLFRIQNRASASLNSILLPNPNERVCICTHSIYIYFLKYCKYFPQSSIAPEALAVEGRRLSLAELFCTTHTHAHNLCRQCWRIRAISEMHGAVFFWKGFQQLHQSLKKKEPWKEKNKTVNMSPPSHRSHSTVTIKKENNQIGQQKYALSWSLCVCVCAYFLSSKDDHWAVNKAEAPQPASKRRQSCAAQTDMFLINHCSLADCTIGPGFICMTQLACRADVLRLDKCSITKNKLPWGRLMQTIREADNGNWAPVFQTSYLGDE